MIGAMPDIGLSLLLFAIALACGALGGALGMAGGIFLVPAPTILTGLPLHTAIGASLVAVIACSCSSSPSLLEARMANIRLAVVLEVATTLGALTGVLITGILPTTALSALFVLVLAVSAFQVQRRRGQDLAAALPAPARSFPGLSSSYPDPERGEIAYHVDRIGFGVGLMYGAGVLSALLGIGSGVLKIPAMDSALRLPIKVSSATSNVMIGVTGAASAGIYFLRGDIDAPIAGPVALGSVFGAILGARLLVRFSNERSRTLLIAVLLLLAAVMAIDATGIGSLAGGGG